MFNQTCEQLVRHRFLLENLEALGLGEGGNSFHPMEDPDKIKYGYLQMSSDGETEDGEWMEEFKRSYFVLVPGHIYSYTRSRDRYPSGHLITNNISVKRLEENSDILVITTPLRSICIKFKDEYEMFEWINALMKSATTSNCGKLLIEMYKR